MRVRHLDLLRYGRFTNVPLELPAQDPDFYIVFGPNEAGKSTALSAIEDLLFGIPHNSPLNFLHDYNSMRIGAVLEKDGETLSVYRRKGNKDTLLTPEGTPILTGDRALVPFLAGADRTFFARMFSLDHERLRQGGREILENNDEVGQTLFSAGSGITGLRQRLMALNQEADALWASRRSKGRRYYQAEERLGEAESALREHTVTASRWQELKRSYEIAQETCDSIVREIETQTIDQRKLSRIRRVYRGVRRKAELDVEIAALGELRSLPEDAHQRLEVAERDDSTATARIETLNEQLEIARKERAALNYDEKLLLRQQDIHQIHERRIQIRAGKADLPKRRAELASAETDLRRLASELGWEAEELDQLMNRIPTRSKVTVIRTLLNRRGERMSNVEGAMEAWQEAEARVTELQEQIDGMGTMVDISQLSVVIDATREMGDITSRISTSEGEVREAQAAIQRHFGSLKPLVADEETLARMPVPPQDTVQAHRDKQRDLEQRKHTCSERIRALQHELDRHKKAYERITSDEDAIAPEELARVRTHRETGWSLIRRRYVEDVSIPEQEIGAFTGRDTDLVTAYEGAVHEADTVADRRFDKAEGAARLAVISRQITEQEDRLETLRREEKVLDDESEALDVRWQDMWRDAPFQVLSPDAMLEWIVARGEVLEAAERRAAAERQLVSLRQEESQARDQLLAELEMMGVEIGPLKTQALRIVLASCIEVQRRHERASEARRQIEERLREVKEDARKKQGALARRRQEWSDWQDQWTPALSALEIDTTTSPEAVATQVDVIDKMREVVVRINELRHERIEKIERDAAAFDHDVMEIVRAVASDLAKAETENAVLELERRLHDAQRIQELQKGKDKAIADLEGKIEGCEESRHDAREVIRHLEESAGVSNINEMKAAIEKSDRLRELQAELAQMMDLLVKEGDGLSVVELESECSAVDLDKIAAREQTVSQELEELRTRLMEKGEQRAAARREFEAIGGDDAAAKAAANKQEALAEMTQVAEQYVRVRSAAILLQWAIDRYRREKQAPLLRRAGELFATLTNGSFKNLQVAFDDQDRAYLIGIRPDGTAVATQGMSTATADQLYLALRIASVEDYLERATPLPFVADDLFVNFDDERAGAGFKVLSLLASKTQVLFFTHHRHLVNIARATLGESIPVVSLVDDRVASPK